VSKEHGRKKSGCEEVHSWELEMVNKVSRAFRTAEPEDLQAELARKLLELKRRMPPNIREWKAYLAKFLYNKASNWVRDSRNRDRRRLALTWEIVEGGSGIFGRGILRSLEKETVVRIALAELLNEFDPEVRELCESLLQENGNQAKVAARLGIHRNTVRLWIRKIRSAANRHGFRG
jgi:RNA polymerase sigma factor (sigma-70 family)